MSLYVCILYIVYHYKLSIVESISTYLKYTIPSPLTSFIPFTILIYMINRKIQKKHENLQCLALFLYMNDPFRSVL